MATQLKVGDIRSITINYGKDKWDISIVCWHNVYPEKGDGTLDYSILDDCLFHKPNIFIKEEVKKIGSSEITVYRVYDGNLLVKEIEAGQGLLIEYVTPWDIEQIERGRKYKNPFEE